MLRLTLIWTCCLVLAPLWLMQGWWLRRTANRMSEVGLKPAPPKRDDTETEDQPNRLHLLGLGDSVIAGVGIQHLDGAITAKLALAMEVSLGEPVKWTAKGCNGDKIEDLLQKLPSPVGLDGKVDMVLVSIGVNDVTSMTSITGWHFSVVNLVGELKRRFRAPVVFLGLPPMGLFPALPQPLRFVLGIRAAMLDLALKQAGEVIEGIYWISPMGSFDAELMASDGFHPSGQANSLWATEMVKQLRAQKCPLISGDEPAS